MAIERAAATADDTLDATADTLVDGLTLTPASDDYFLFATVEFQTDATSEDHRNRFTVYVGGVVVDHSERSYNESPSVDSAFFCISLSCKVSPNGSQAVEIRHRTNDALSPLVAKKRELNLFPINGTDVQNSAIPSDTTTSASFVAIVGMTMTTPAANDYLLSYSSSIKNGTSASELQLRVTVGGVEIPHSVRNDTGESSDSDKERPINVTVHVSPDGTEDVVMEWRRVSGTDTLSMGDRTMNLIPTASVDIFEASGTADDADSTTDDKRIDDLVIADPGADDYLVIGSSSDHFGTITADNEVTYSIHEGGALVVDSERIQEHEASIDNANRPIVAGGRVTVGGAADIEMFWKGNTTDTRTIRQRTLVALREQTVVILSGVSRVCLRSSIGIYGFWLILGQILTGTGGWW